MLIVFKVFGLVIFITGLYFTIASFMELYESHSMFNSRSLIEVDATIKGYESKTSKLVNERVGGSPTTGHWYPQPVYTFFKLSGKKITKTDPNYNLWETYKKGQKIKIFIDKYAYESEDKRFELIFARVKDFHTRYLYFGLGAIFGIVLMLMSCIPLFIIRF